MHPWLSDEEISDLCEGCKRNHERLRYLRGLGLIVKVKPNGAPLVLRSNVEAVLGGVPTKMVQSQSAEPNRAALIALLGGKHGKASQIKPA